MYINLYVIDPKSGISYTHSIVPCVFCSQYFPQISLPFRLQKKKNQIFFYIYFIFNYMYGCVYMRAGAHGGQRCWTPRDGITGNCEQPDRDWSALDDMLAGKQETKGL